MLNNHENDHDNDEVCNDNDDDNNDNDSDYITQMMIIMKMVAITMTTTITTFHDKGNPSELNRVEHEVIRNKLLNRFHIQSRYQKLVKMIYEAKWLVMYILV